ncbi:MAG: putative toxin-antitoxin system toxin component, PIN family [Candidatus Azobacteroides sp.]|nr:putative toxin-antitoxin system toxin component, PIN family [Candidatus Azobacteroides sp.]
MKIVLDTNCLLLAVPKKSNYHCILTALQQGRYTLCYSNDILMEYEEMLVRFYTQQIAGHVLSFVFYSINTLMITPYFQWNLISADADDNKFVDCALNAGVDYIVTNDRHFNVLKSLNFPPINVIDIETFKNLLNL